MGELVIDLVWKLYDMAFENVVVPEDSGTVASITLFKGTKSKRYRCIKTAECS